jgi:hypothetical protein
MTPQQKQLWEEITNQARESGMDNLHARKLYDKLSKLINMSDKIVLAITEKEDGLEVKIGEQAYGNLAIVGLLEKIKFNLLSDVPEEVSVLDSEPKKTSQKYDA